MIPDYYYRVADFIADLFGFPAGASFPPDPLAIKLMIAIIVSTGYKTREELSLAALAKHNLILRDDLFPREVKR